MRYNSVAMCNYVATWTTKESWFDYRQVRDTPLQSAQICFQPIRSFIKCLYRDSSLGDKAAGAWSSQFTSQSTPKLRIRGAQTPFPHCLHSIILY